MDLNEEDQNVGASSRQIVSGSSLLPQAATTFRDAEVNHQSVTYPVQRNPYDTVHTDGIQQSEEVTGLPINENHISEEVKL